LKAKVTVKGFELNADIPITSELMAKGLAVKNQLKESKAMLFVFEVRVQLEDLLYVEVAYYEQTKLLLSVVMLSGNQLF
jgi:uncharacterized membrane protein (UPF0127 family)